MSDAVSFWRPDAQLQPYVSGYHRYDIAVAPGERIADVFYPAWMNIRFTFDADGPWSLRLGRRRMVVPPCAFFGPSSHAGYVDAPRGTMIGAGLTPLGWAALFGGDVSRHADRVVALDDLVPDAIALHDAVRAGAAPDAAFDGWLCARLGAGRTPDPLVAAVFTHLNDPAIDTAGALASAVGATPRQLLRVTRRNFGFPPKLLLRRARFLRALLSADALDRGGWTEAARDAGYWDGSHFLRDCHLFLDCTLSAFLALDKPLNRASMIARKRALGAPMQSMHR